MALAQQRLTYTVDDIYALPDGQRAELIDGQMYMMAPPNTTNGSHIHLPERSLTTLTGKTEIAKYSWRRLQCS